jgi:hypothetical protein
MERCVYRYVHNYLLQNGGITPNQSGFTRGDSAINQLVEISNSFVKELFDSSKTVCKTKKLLNSSAFSVSL